MKITSNIRTNAKPTESIDSFQFGEKFRFPKTIYYLIENAISNGCYCHYDIVQFHRLSISHRYLCSFHWHTYHFGCLSAYQRQQKMRRSVSKPHYNVHAQKCNLVSGQLHGVLPLGLHP